MLWSKLILIKKFRAAGLCEGGRGTFGCNLLPSSQSEQPMKSSTHEIDVFPWTEFNQANDMVLRGV